MVGTITIVCFESILYNIVERLLMWLHIGSKYNGV